MLKAINLIVKTVLINAVIRFVFVFVFLLVGIRCF